MRYDFIEAHRPMWHLRHMCKALGVSRSGYFSWRNRGPSRRSCEDAELTELISASSQRSRGTYGSPRIHDDLKDKGLKTSRKRVARLMTEAGISSCHRRKKHIVTTDSNHDQPVNKNILQQDFSASQANSKWVTDITYIRTNAGWLYLAAVMDLYSRKIVGWAMREHMTSELVLRAFDMAINKRHPKENLIHHSDRGSQYASREYRQALEKSQVIQSMSRKGCCYDNAAMESFFHTLKVECVHRNNFQTRLEATQAIFEYIETFYNRTRKHSTLGNVSPEQFERHNKDCA